MEQSDNIDPRIVEQMMGVEDLIINRAINAGVYQTLMQITERYGEIMTAKGEDYTEIALSYLNLFDTETQDIIRQSMWFRTMIAYKIPVHIIYKELQIIQSYWKNVKLRFNLENYRDFLEQKIKLSHIKANLPSSLTYFKEGK